MMGAQYGEETGVDDDLTEVVGTGDVPEQASAGDGVTRRVLHLQPGELLVGLQLLVPGNQEDEGGQPGGPGDRPGGDLTQRDGGGPGDEPGSLAEEARGGAEVVSVAHDVVRDVHGGGAGLVDDGALVEPPEDLERQESEGQDEVGGTGPDRPPLSAD